MNAQMVGVSISMTISKKKRVIQSKLINAIEKRYYKTNVNEIQYLI